MPGIQDGDQVQVHYTGTLKDGSVFDSSYDREPLAFVQGSGMLLPAFEQATKGMASGEKKTFIIPAGEGYGEYNEDLVVQVERAAFPADIDPIVGLQLQVGKTDEEMSVVTITHVSDTQVLLDANHPLAGEELTFAIEIVAINA
jgi:peptidylprolyl isomerase